MDAILTYFFAVPLWQTAAACVLLALQVVANAFDQAHIWARGGRPSSRLLSRVRVHAVDEVQELGYHAFALLLGNPVAVLGTALAVRPLFEGIINVGVGRSFFDEGAEADDFIVRIGDWELYRRPKVNSKYGRFAQTVVGLAMIGLSPAAASLLL